MYWGVTGGTGHAQEGGEGGEGGEHDQLVTGVHSIICQELEVRVKQGEAFTQYCTGMIMRAFSN